MTRRILAMTLLLLAVMCAPAAASSRQLTIMQDDAVFLGSSPHDPEQAMADAKALGVDVVRVFVGWSKVSSQSTSRVKPAGFDVSNPDSPGYNWSVYDALVDRARRYGLKLYFTLAPPLPYWASEDPNGCPHPTGGYFFLKKTCDWKPSPRLYGQFAQAVARRYGSRATGSHGGSVILYSLWNEPNLEHYLFPQVEGRPGQGVDWAARQYRRLWYEGWKGLSAADPPMRNRVLFGETAAISSPLDTLFAALCLDQNGRPFKGARRKRQGCSHPRKLPIGGIAIHPYNNHATGSVFTKSFSRDSHAVAYVPRVSKLIDRAARYGRIPRARNIFLTEFGFQSNPPDSTYGLSLNRHAGAINEADRLYFGDRRVESVAQFELYDVPAPAVEREENDVYTTGLAFRDGTHKPAWDAFRMPAVVTRLSASQVEVWGQVRPAEGSTMATITTSPGVGRPFVAAMRVSTNPSGYFRVHLRRGGAARMRYRIEWTGPAGTVLRSRVARAGRRIRYLPDPPPKPKQNPVKRR
jgi:hypothetical protein